MASSRLHLLLIIYVLLQLCFMFFLVTADDEADKLLQRINSYRLSLRLPALVENDNADCLADQIAEQLEDQPCPTAITPRLPQAQFENYPKPLDKCHLTLNNTREGAILLSCIPSRAKSLTTFNFTDPVYSTFLNNSKYIGAGVGSEDEWIVVVLTTNAPGGSFVTSGANSLVIPQLVMFFGLFVASSANGLLFSQLVFMFFGTLLFLGLYA